MSAARRPGPKTAAEAEATIDPDTLAAIRERARELARNAPPLTERQRANLQRALWAPDVPAPDTTTPKDHHA